MSSTDLISEDDYKQINYNSIKIAHDGRDPECKVFYQGKEKNLKEVLIVIFEELESLATKIREQLSNEAKDSLKRQKNIEANDSVDYYSYIKNQFKIK